MSAAPPARSPLARRLREARTAAGISQRTLGIEIGIDPSSASPRINQYETDKHRPNFEVARRLAERLAVPVTYLYAEDDRLAAMILAFSALTSSQQSRALKAVQERELPW